MADNKFEMDFLGMINQVADMAMEKILIDMMSDYPMIVGLIKLLGEYDIRGMRAFEFLQKMAAVCNFFDGEKKEGNEGC